MPGGSRDVGPEPPILPGKQYRARELRNRGLLRKGGWQSRNASWGLLWTANTRQRISRLVSVGRIQSLDPIVERNCL